MVLGLEPELFFTVCLMIMFGGTVGAAYTQPTRKGQKSGFWYKAFVAVMSVGLVGVVVTMFIKPIG